VILAAPDSEHARTFMDIASQVALKVAGKVLSQPRKSPRLAVIR
jgi:hypothetical protein